MMHVCSVLLRVWKNNVKNVVGVMSFLLLVLVLSMPVAAKDYHIRASDGELYTITVGEGTDVEDFSIQKSNGEMLRGVTEDERVIATELYFASRLLWIIRTYYSPETPFEDWEQVVRDIVNTALINLTLTQMGDIIFGGGISALGSAVSNFSLTSVVGVIASAINTGRVLEPERQLLVFASKLAIICGRLTTNLEGVLRQRWTSYETRSITISIDEINDTWESYHKMVQYHLLASELVNSYLQTPDLKERLANQFQGTVVGTIVSSTTEIKGAGDIASSVLSTIETNRAIKTIEEHIQQLEDLAKKGDEEIHNQALARIDTGKKQARAALEQGGFFAPPSLEAVGAIKHIQLTLGGDATTIDIKKYFSSSNDLRYEVESNPSGIVRESISGSRVTIRPMAAGVTTVIVTARDVDNTSLTAIQTISVSVRQTGAVIGRPRNTDPTFTVPDGSNPEAKGLREGVSVIIDNLAPNKTLNVRQEPNIPEPWEPDNIEEKLGNGVKGIITDGPRYEDTYKWWKIEWDSINIEGWSAEAVNRVGGGSRVQVILRRPPDMQIRDLDVSDDEVSPGQEFELEVKIRNNGPGESAATDVYFYYSENRHSNIEELSEEDDLRGGWTLRVPSLQERGSKTLRLTVEAPMTPDRYYYGALLPSNIHDTDYKGDLAPEMRENNLAREERVEVTSSPDLIVLSISVREVTLDPGENFTLKVTVQNQGLGEPQTTPTLLYYLSDDVRISVNDKEVGEDRVSRLDTGETGNESISLTAPTEPGIYFYGACVQKVENESDRSNNCSSAVAITVRSLQTVEVIVPLVGDVNADGVVNIQDLVLVAANFGKTGTNDADVNNDGIVNIQDLVLVAANFGSNAAAPLLYPNLQETLTTAEVQRWLSEAQQLNLTDATSQHGVHFLEQLLAALTPKKTALLPNYPNPFNPETWIPYRLAKPADVKISIYAANGKLVRTLALGHQSVGIYQHRSRAAYWDGTNEIGEQVASGIYFYTLTAGNFSATRKMLILK